MCIRDRVTPAQGSAPTQRYAALPRHDPRQPTGDARGRIRVLAQCDRRLDDPFVVQRIVGQQQRDRRTHRLHDVPTTADFVCRAVGEDVRHQFVVLGAASRVDLVESGSRGRPGLGGRHTLQEAPGGQAVCLLYTSRCV